MPYKDLPDAFPSFRVSFVSKDGLIIYDEKSRYRFVEFEYRDFEKGDMPERRCFFEVNSEQMEVYCTPKDYFVACEKVHGKDISNCLTSLFFIVNEKFNELPWKGEIPDYKHNSQLLYYSIICDKKDAKTLDTTFRTMCAASGLKEYQKYVKVTMLENRTVFSMDIAVFEHLIAPTHFAYGCGFAKNVRVSIGKKFDGFGSMKPDLWVDSENNAFHPDKMTIEQKLRWSS